MLTYSTTVFCNSTGRAKRAGSSGDVCSMAAEPPEGDWVMVDWSWPGVTGASHALDSDIVCHLSSVGLQ